MTAKMFALTKVSDAVFCALDPETEKWAHDLPRGTVIRAAFKKARNSKFHRKFFALLTIGFDAWEPSIEDTSWGTPQKNFEQFREDVTILAGYYTLDVRLDGSTRVSAKSISFANMGEEEFEQLYSKVVDVILQRVLTTYNRADLDRVVDQVLGMC